MTYCNFMAEDEVIEGNSVNWLSLHYGLVIWKRKFTFEALKIRLQANPYAIARILEGLRR